METETVGLKACPFCGGRAAAQQYRARSWGAGCVNNECQHTLTAEAYGTSRARAIAAWNTRTDPDGLREALEEARDTILRMATVGVDLARHEVGIRAATKIDAALSSAPLEGR